jgi:hypothetical protein
VPPSRSSQPCFCCSRQPHPSRRVQANLVESKPSFSSSPSQPRGVQASFMPASRSSTFISFKAAGRGPHLQVTSTPPTPEGRSEQNRTVHQGRYPPAPAVRLHGGSPPRQWNPALVSLKQSRSSRSHQPRVPSSRLVRASSRLVCGSSRSSRIHTTTL